MSEAKDKAFDEAWDGVLSEWRAVLLLEAGLAMRQGSPTMRSEMALVALVRKAFSAGWDARGRRGEA